MKTIQLTANDLRFTAFEEGEGPLVLLLHGFPDTPQTWDLVQPAIARAGYRVVAPFLRGYAPTEAPPRDAYDSVTLGRDVLALIEALGERQAVVIGHDWGAVSAWAAASLGPEHIARLVPVAIPHPASLRPYPAKLWGVRHFLMLRLPGAAGRFAQNDFAGVRELYERWSPGQAWSEDEFTAVKKAFATPGCLQATLGYYRQLSPFQPASLRVPVRVPTLVVGGQTDGLADREDFARSEAWVDAPFELAMLPGGHFLHREHPQPFLDAVLGWLAR